MAGISDGLEMTKNKLIELNNNGRTSPDRSKINKLRKTSEVPVSNISSGLSDRTVDNNCTKIARQRSLQDLLVRNKSENKIPAFQRGRSNSDGAATTLVDNAEVFPSLPIPVLEKMGLYGDAPRERLSEETLEQKFTSLSLAFTIDAATIKDRCERQKRTRDQTETNFNLEVEKLRQKLALLQPLCTDFDRAELLSTLFAQVDTLTNAASLVSIAGERFGAVQHEERLTESVQLMVNHVQALKQQRDSARRQLQYTKRVLQEPIEPMTNNGSQNNKNLGGISKKVINKRRASIDPVNLSQQEQHFSFNRRISDLSFRASLAKSNRPSRFELGMELNKIKEISHDDSGKDHPFKETPEIPSPDTDRKDGFNFESKTNNTVTVENEEPLYGRNLKDTANLVGVKLLSYLEKILQKLEKIFNKWPENGYLHAFLNSCAVLCFSISILTLASIFLEHEYVKGFSYGILPWCNRKK